MDSVTRAATFDMGRAWEDGMARVRANVSLLVILAGVFFFLPGVVLYLSMPELMDMMMMPGGDPEAMSKAMEAMLPQFMGGALIVMVVSFVGYAAMMALMGDPARLSVAESIGRGFRSLPTLIGVLLIAMVAYLILAVIVGVVFGLIVGGLGAVSTALGYGAAVILGIALFVAVLLLMVRVSMTMAVVVLDRVLNPFTALRRSWTMTRSVQWRLLGFYILFFIAYFVLAILLMMVLGLVAAALGSPAVLGFLNGFIGAAVAVVMSGLFVGIYRQLAVPDAG